MRFVVDFLGRKNVAMRVLSAYALLLRRSRLTNLPSLWGAHNQKGRRKNHRRLRSRRRGLLTEPWLCLWPSCLVDSRPEVVTVSRFEVVTVHWCLQHRAMFVELVFCKEKVSSISFSAAVSKPASSKVTFCVTYEGSCKLSQTRTVLWKWRIQQRVGNGDVGQKGNTGAKGIYREARS